MKDARSTLTGFILGALVVSAVVLWIGKSKEAPVPNDICRYVETIRHPDLGTKLALLEVHTWDRPEEAYYVTVLLSDLEPCYVSPARVYRKPSLREARESFFKTGADEVKNAVQCLYRQNPTDFGSASAK